MINPTYWNSRTFKSIIYIYTYGLVQFQVKLASSNIFKLPGLFLLRLSMLLYNNLFTVLIFQLYLCLYLDSLSEIGNLYRVRLIYCQPLKIVSHLTSLKIKWEWRTFTLIVKKFNYNLKPIIYFWIHHLD